MIKILRVSTEMSTIGETFSNVGKYCALNESDHDEFFVHYIGCTPITEDYDISSDKQIDEFFKYVVSEYQKNSVSDMWFKLRIDTDSAVICNDDEKIQHSFKACNISDITTTKLWKYSRYLIIVARTTNERSLKGHVLLCNNKSNVQRICQTFSEMFRTARPITNARKEKGTIAGDSQPEADSCGVSVIETRKTSDRIDGFCTKDSNKGSFYEVKSNDTSSGHHADEKPAESVDAFTELAKSRSRSSHSSDDGMTPRSHKTFF